MKVPGIMVSSQSAALRAVLVVEDEMLLRMRAVDIVEDAGYTPVEAVNADDALAILESRSDIELLFTDIQMPGSMDGLKLAYAVHERWPLIKIILVSGQVEIDRRGQARRQPLLRQAARRQADDRGNAGHDRQWLVEDRARRSFRADREGGASGIERHAIRSGAAGSTQEFLTAENDSLRLLLEQAGIDAKVLLAQAGIDAKEREAADKLQKLILEELHHRIKNTLATVSAIASQSLRTATSIEHGQHAIEGRLVALGRAHDLLLQARWANASLEQTIRGATEPYVTIRFGQESRSRGPTSGSRRAP